MTEKIEPSGYCAWHEYDGFLPFYFRETLKEVERDVSNDYHEYAGERESLSLIIKPVSIVEHAEYVRLIEWARKCSKFLDNIAIKIAEVDPVLHGQQVDLVMTQPDALTSERGGDEI